jgi:hypothetical protein
MSTRSQETAAENSQRILLWGLLIGIAVAEIVTIACRIFFDQSAAEFNATNPPWILKIHHMFWAVPFISIGLVGLALGKKMIWPWIITISLVASDHLHHFVVLPLWVGNTGWHWP